MIQAGRYSVVPDDLSTHVPVVINNFTSIASGLTIVSGNHPTVANPNAVSTFPFKEWGWGDYSPCTDRGGVNIGSDVWIGQDVTIMDGLWIADGAIIAAGSVVTKSIGAFEVWGGNPAKLLYKRFHYDLIAKLMEIKWWNWPDERIKSFLPLMKDIYEFLNIHEE